MEPPTLLVVGGGVAGLAGARAARLAASELDLPLRISLLEASDRLGGKVFTETVDGAPYEWGPDSFLAAKPWARELAEELGLGGDLVSPATSRTYLWLGGRLRPLPAGLAMGVPTGVGPLLRAVRDGIVGPLGALRAAVEPLLPARPRAHDTVADATRRRLGRQVADRLVAPLVSGVYGVPTEELGMRDALPQLAGVRSLVLAMSRRPPSEGPIFLSLRGGMQRLVDRLAQALAPEDVRLACPALALTPDDERLRVRTPAGDVTADAVLLAAPAPAAAGLLGPVAPAAAGTLAAIRYHASAVGYLRYAPEDIDRALDGSGYLASLEEDGVVAACSWVGAKWPHLRASSPLLRVVVTDAGALSLPDASLRERVSEEVGRVMRASRSPLELRLFRWPEAMPVYAPGHADRMAAARRALPPRIALAGAACEGVGVPDCIRTGQEAARALVSSLAQA